MLEQLWPWASVQHKTHWGYEAACARYFITHQDVFMVHIVGEFLRLSVLIEAHVGVLTGAHRLVLSKDTEPTHTT